MVALIVLIIVVLVGMAILHGIKTCDGWAFHIDLNTFKTPYYIIGVDHHREESEHSMMSILTIGIIVINFTFEFHKFIIRTDEEIKLMEEAQKIFYKILENKTTEA